VNGLTTRDAATKALHCNHLCKDHVPHGAASRLAAFVCKRILEPASRKSQAGIAVEAGLVSLNMPTS
jgi:hypothetical protein